MTDESVDNVIHGTIDLGWGRSKQYRLVLEANELQVLVRYVDSLGQVTEVKTEVLSARAGFTAVRDGEDIVVTIFSRTGLFPAKRHRF